MALLYTFFLLVLANNLQAITIHFGNKYSFEETLLIDDGSASKVGYQIKGTIKLELLKKGLYLVTLEAPKLSIYAKKNKAYKFLPHISSVEYYNNDPFLIELSNGLVKNLYISKRDDKGMVNIKKTISNLFQFQTTNFDGEEIDLSGTCKVSYKLNSPNNILKTKENCIHPNSTTSSSVWGAKFLRKQNTNLYLENDKIFSIKSNEEFILVPHLSEVIKANITLKVEIKSIENGILSEKYPSEDVKDVITRLESEIGRLFEIYKLIPQNKDITCHNCPKFSKIVTENAEYLENKYLGDSKSASSFIAVLQAARRSSVQDIYNSINSKKNKKILPQLMDILGATQTVNTHQAALKFLKISTDKYDLDLCERYFWALSMSPIVQHDILKDLQQLVNNKHNNHKLWQTIILTWTAMVNKYSRQENSDEHIAETIKFLSEKIKECNGIDHCQLIYIKALGNIPNKKALPVLLEIIENSVEKSEALAMKVIRKMDPKLWDKDVLQLSEKIVLSNQSYSSSSRIFALDILLHSELTFNQLSRIVLILQQENKSRELKEYLLQRLTELSEFGDKSFKNALKKICIMNGCNNYDSLSQGGLSTAFSRRFMSNGTLSTSQEIVGGVLKQGNVNINLLHNERIETPFTLGIFAGGLSSFVSTDEENEIDDEVATAGLELTVLGVEVRPFVFFNGTGELMGHVWSGTASSLTPAYQALQLLDDHTSLIPLVNAEILAIRSVSAASMDLSGKIEISLWNRNAKSLVKNRAGLFLGHSINITAPFIDVDISFNLNVEPELHLTADLDFSSGSSLCLKLQQPKTQVKYFSEKREIIPDNKQIIQRRRFLNLHIPERTFSLNTKNNDMCRRILS